MAIEGVWRKVQFISPRKDEINDNAINLSIFRGLKTPKRNPICNNVRKPRKDALLLISRPTLSNPKIMLQLTRAQRLRKIQLALQTVLVTLHKRLERILRIKRVDYPPTLKTKQEAWASLRRVRFAVPTLLRTQGQGSSI
jgi:hypothetical protein